jgi:ketol-acid reductoisomerase
MFKELSKDTTLGIIGHGNQAKAWVQNLQDSNFLVELATRTKIENPSLSYPVQTITPEWLQKQVAMVLLIPDHEHLNFLQKYSPFIQEGTLLIYAHGESMSKDKVQNLYPKFHHALLAPKAIASGLRANYLEKKSLTAVYSVEYCPESAQKNIETYLLYIATSLGITYGPFSVTATQEYHCDLLSEQTLLCHYLPILLGHTVEFALSKNLPPHLVFAEFFLELKLIIEAFEKVGPEKFYQLISPNALVGAHDQWQQTPLKELLLPFMNRCWQHITSGEFASKVTQESIEKSRLDWSSFWNKHPLQLLFKDYECHLKKNIPSILSN